ncbi:CHAD domain-containing protein [Nocardia australiensis]|uniref:CHAD domain-containing protein n=1 Tax=Nocardia australiensis TaxID=2887191 RepID=UPI001D15BF1B|nr:CHAD domain-containing protein [Nocardia australiensis]
MVSESSSDTTVAARHDTGALAEYLFAQRSAILAAENAVRGGDLDAVGRTVVATRRARSALSAHRSAVAHHPDVRRLIEELRWFGFGLSMIRDLDIQGTRIGAVIDTLRPKYVRGPVRKRVASYFEARIRPARADALDSLRSDRYTTMLTDLTAEAMALTAGDSSRRAENMSVVLEVLAERVRKRMITVGTISDEDAHDAAVHGVRKAARRIRYYLESVRELDPQDCDIALGELVAVQDLLGEHQDAVVAKHHLLQLTREAEQAGESTFVYGLLCHRELDVTARCSAQLPDAWRRALPAIESVGEDQRTSAPSVRDK